MDRDAHTHFVGVKLDLGGPHDAIGVVRAQQVQAADAAGPTRHRFAYRHPTEPQPLAAELLDSELVLPIDSSVTTALQQLQGTPDDKLATAWLPASAEPLHFFAITAQRQQQRCDAGLSAMTGSAAPAGAIAAGTGQAAALIDGTASITAKLFAPFSAGEFPSTLQAQMLSNLLFRPPSSHVPVPPSFVSTAEAAWADHTSPLLVRESNTSAPLLASLLFSALTRPWPLAPTSELRLTSIWDLIGLGFPEEVGQILKLPLHHTRNVEEESVTEGSTKRDYMCFVNKQPCVVGEDKTYRHQIEAAVKDAVEKYKAVNALTYGKLGYLLLLAMAGEVMAVYAMPLAESLTRHSLVPLVSPFEVSGPVGRTKAVKIAINITRWLITIHDLQLLPPSPRYEVYERVERPSPYPAFMGRKPPTQLTMKFGFVEKRLEVPPEYLQRLLDVYGMLHEGVPGAICIQRLMVGSQRVDLPQAHYETQQHRHALVKLQLEPIGHSWNLNSPQRMVQFANSLLMTLKHVHDKGFVHCDVRADNVVEIPGGWLLIDWELAGKSGAEVFWDSLAAPPGVHHGSQWLASHDLWQMGKLIKDQLHGESLALAQFAERLQRADITNAIALENLTQIAAQL